jgi:hypothetical protein
LQKQDNIMQRVAIVMALLAILSGTSANMGTAIVIAGTIHFFVCNPVIALLEAALLARWARVPLQRAIALMIAANCLSFFVGLLLGGRISLTLGGISQMLWGKGVTFFLSLPYLLALLTLLLFALTVLIEAMPLYLAQQRDWRWSIGHSARVNLISYGLLVFLYLKHSDFGFLTNRFQPDLRFIQTVPTTVYYITPDGMLASIPITGGAYRLLDEPRLSDEGWRTNIYAPPSLQLHRDSKSNRWWLATKWQRLFPVEVDPLHIPRNLWKQGKDAPIYSPDWRDASAEWRITPYLPTVYQGNQRRYSTALILPFRFDVSQNMGVFPCRAISLLPGDYAVFELGGCIWVLHMPTRRIGFLTEGSMPLAVVMPHTTKGKNEGQPSTPEVK